MQERFHEILKIALEYDVTDIHFNVKEESETIKIEMRVKGEIKQVKTKQNDMRLFRYLMYRANLDISDACLPQTGAFTESLGSMQLSLRFALVSSYRMKTAVLRILNQQNRLEVSMLTRDLDVLHYLRDISYQTNGLYLFTGPTGAGKTTTLYTLLNEMKGKKIFTLEDPIEVIQEDYVQIQINEKQNMTYEQGIRQLMRHDPDIIMIGEIRDSNVAKMVVRCALTGHLVVTTLHSFSCVSAILRMIDLGVDKYQLQDVLKGITNQRLFSCGDGKKIGIYEFMDASQLKYYFKHEKNPENFMDLKTRIEEAYAKNEIQTVEAII